MRKLFISLLAVICLGGAVNAQDIIVTKEGKKIEAKVTEINENDIKYKSYNNLDGPLYFMKKADIASILYENGQIDVFKVPDISNVPTQIRSNSTFTRNDFYNAKDLRNTGIGLLAISATSVIVGGTLLGVGLKGNTYYDGYGSYYRDEREDLVISGAVILGVVGPLIIPGIISTIVGQTKVNRINADGYSLFENKKTQLNLLVGGNSIGLKLHF